MALVEKVIPVSVLRGVLDLRLLIARAGEKDSLAWWDSYALTDQGQWALKRLYPRYAAYAGARLAIEAAVMTHAKIIARRPAVTLFGLGVALDARVMGQLDLQRMDDELLTIAPPIRSPEELRATLAQIVEVTDDDLALVKSAVANGPLVELETVTEAEVWSENTLPVIARRLAVTYTLSEFGRLMVPYYRLKN